MWLPLVSWSAISVEGQGNVNIGGHFLEVNSAMSKISAHPLVWTQSKVQRPWALFCETTVQVYIGVWTIQSCSSMMLTPWTGNFKLLRTHKHPSANWNRYAWVYSHSFIYLQVCLQEAPWSVVWCMVDSAVHVYPCGSHILVHTQLPNPTWKIRGPCACE